MPKKTDERTGLDAARMLRQDHRKVEELFKRFEHGGEGKKEICDQIYKELKIHSEIEERLFYPAVKQATGGEDEVEHSYEEHAKIKRLIGELEDMELDEEEYEAKFKTLVENVQEHVTEEESEILPKAESSGLDLVGLGEKMAEMKRSLGAEAPETEGERRGGAGTRSRGARRGPRGRKAMKSKTRR